MAYEYKTVGAPEKAKRRRGARTQSARVAATFEDILHEEAIDGWEYQRTDLLPVMENSGWLRRGHEVHRAVMVFRRPLERAELSTGASRLDDTTLALSTNHRKPVHTPPQRTESAPTGAVASSPAPRAEPRAEPAIRDDPDLRIAEMVRGPGKSRSGD